MAADLTLPYIEVLPEEELFLYITGYAWWWGSGFC